MMAGDCGVNLVSGCTHGAKSWRAPPLLFETVIVPHQSLSRRGLLYVACCVVTVSFVISLRFLFLGAWPVMAFSILEALFALLLLAMHRRQGLRREAIKLDETKITIVAIDARGRRQSFSLPAAWLQVSLKAGVDEGHGSRLWLHSHGRSREVGAFLHDSERRSLAEALTAALHRLRNPIFHNEQLLEC